MNSVHRKKLNSFASTQEAELCLSAHSLKKMFCKNNMNISKLDDALAKRPTVMVGETKQTKKMGENRGILKLSWACVETKRTFSCIPDYTVCRHFSVKQSLKKILKKNIVYRKLPLRMQYFCENNVYRKCSARISCFYENNVHRKKSFCNF